MLSALSWCYSRLSGNINDFKWLAMPMTTCHGENGSTQLGSQSVTGHVWYEDTL
jgi:hypothetical protein